MNEIRVNIDDGQARELERRARLHGHSIDAEVRAIIDQTIKAPMPREDFIRRARAIAAMTPEGISQTDSFVLLREDRDR